MRIPLLILLPLLGDQSNPQFTFESLLLFPLDERSSENSGAREVLGGRITRFKRERGEEGGENAVVNERESAKVRRSEAAEGEGKDLRLDLKEPGEEIIVSIRLSSGLKRARTQTCSQCRREACKVTKRKAQLLRFRFGTAGDG